MKKLVIILIATITFYGPINADNLAPFSQKELWKLTVPLLEDGHGLYRNHQIGYMLHKMVKDDDLKSCTFSKENSFIRGELIIMPYQENPTNPIKPAPMYMWGIVLGKQENGLYKIQNLVGIFDLDASQLGKTRLQAGTAKPGSTFHGG